MSAQPFGFNVHLRYIKDIGAFYKRMDSLRPAVNVVMVDDDQQPGKEDQTVHIQEFAARYPESLTVARVKHDHDGGFHNPPHNDPQKRPRVAEPVDVLNKWGDLGRGSMSLYLLNEPMAKEDMTDDEIRRLVGWCSEVIEEAARRDISLTLPNFGMGQPGIDKPFVGQWDARLDPLLVLLSKYRDLMFLGIHEYGTEEPYHWGRLMFMLARCKALDIQPPRVVVTEFGVDATHGPRNGYKARGWSGDHYMRQLAGVYKRVYAPLVEQGVVKGTCLFSYGNSGGWQSFDVEDDKAFFDTLTFAVAAGSLRQTRESPVVKPVEPPTQEVPVVKPNPPPLPPVTEPVRRKRSITVEATDEEWAQLSVAALSALDALSKLAGLGEPLKALLSRIVISDLSEGVSV